MQVLVDLTLAISSLWFCVNCTGQVHTNTQEYPRLPHVIWSSTTVVQCSMEWKHCTIRVPTVMENPGKNCCHGKSWKSLGMWKFPKKSWKSHGIACSHGYSSFLVCDCHACRETQSQPYLKPCENGSHGNKQISHGKVMEFCFQVFVGTLTMEYESFKRFKNFRTCMWSTKNTQECRTRLCHRLAKMTDLGLTVATASEINLCKVMWFSEVYSMHAVRTEFELWIDQLPSHSLQEGHPSLITVHCLPTRHVITAMLQHPWSSFHCEICHITKECFCWNVNIATGTMGCSGSLFFSLFWRGLMLSHAPRNQNLGHSSDRVGAKPPGRTHWALWAVQPIGSIPELDVLVSHYVPLFFVINSRYM